MTQHEDGDDMATTTTSKSNGKNSKAKDGPLPPVVAGKQAEIPGTERPKPPKEIAKAAEALRSAFNAEKRARKATTEKRKALEALMVEAKVPEVLIEDDEGDQVRIWVDVSTKVKMAVVEED